VPHHVVEQPATVAGATKEGDMAAIELHGLTKRFGSVTAVDDLTLELAAGTITGFLGPNGAGKTTTLRMLLGLVTPTSGSATFSGRRYVDLDGPARRVGAVLEASCFHPGRRAIDHLRILASSADLPVARAHEALVEVGLAEHARRRIGGFSLGMRQRLGLAAALLGRPDVLILDEPANGLDPEGVQWLRLFLRDQADSGRTVVVSSHLLAEVSQTVDHVVILDKGRLVTSAPLAALTAPSAAAVVVTTPDAERLRARLADAGITASCVGDRVTAAGTTPQAVGRVIGVNGFVVYEMRLEQPHLEDVFFALTTHQHHTNHQERSAS
jgi:ABC-2 type transport system ATP-binding protein